MEQPKNLTKKEKYKLVEVDYDNVVDWYDRKYNASLNFAPQLNDFKNHLPLKAKILDVASGTGYEANEFSKMGSVTALDLSIKMLHRLKEKYPNIKTLAANMNSIPLPDNSFDAVWSCRGIIHVPHEDLEQTIEEFDRVLKPGGALGLIFFITKENTPWEEQFLPEEEDVPNRDGLVYYRNLYGIEHIIRILEERGIKIEKVERLNDSGDEAAYIRGCKYNKCI